MSTGKKRQGHRQRGAGTIAVSKGDRIHQGVLCKEWQRTPMQLLHEYCQSNKKSNPRYIQVQTSQDDLFRIRCVLADSKNAKKTLTFCTAQEFQSQDEAKHCSALLALKHVDPLRPFEQKLPDPYRQLWLTLSSAKSDTTTISSNGKKAVKNESSLRRTKKETIDENEINMWGGDDSIDENENKSIEKHIFPDMLTADRAFASQAERENAKIHRQQKSNKLNRRRENRERANMPCQVLMSTDCRNMIDNMLKSLGSSIASPDMNRNNHINQHSSSKKIPPKLRENMMNQLLELGFKIEQVNDALYACEPLGSDSNIEDLAKEYQTMVLDWLCINVNEGELPKGFNPDGKQLDVVQSKKRVETDEGTIAHPMITAIIQRLMSWGYCRSDAIHVVNQYLSEHANMVETFASDVGLKEEKITSTQQGNCHGSSSQLNITVGLLQLLAPLLHRHFGLLNYPGEDDKVPSKGDIMSMQQDELFAIKAIYNEQATTRLIPISSPERNVTDDAIKYITWLSIDVTSSLMLEIFFTPSCTYPFGAPIFAISTPLLDSTFRGISMLNLCGEILTAIDSIPQGEPKIYEMCMAVEPALNRVMLQRNAGNILQKISLFPHSNDSTLPSTHEAKTGDDCKESVIPTPIKSENSNRSRTNRHYNRKKRNEQIVEQTEELIKLENDNLFEQNQRKANDSKFIAIQKSRANLPAFKEMQNVITLVDNHQVLLISGATGCGKTTQIPQFILDSEINNKNGCKCHIICTQPRRLAAIGVATRVAEERCEPLGKIVGYQIRMEGKKSRETKLLFCTTGVLLRKLLTNRNLVGVSHVIIDEIHERSVDTDFLLSILRNLLPQRPDLRIILMSATMDSSLFARYFAGSCATDCPVLDIPGYTYPVTTYYLQDILNKTNYNIPKRFLKKVDKSFNQQDMTVNDIVKYYDDSHLDYDLLVNLVSWLVRSKNTKQGSILIFLSGTAEIKNMMNSLQNSSCSTYLKVLPLHGSLSSKAQSAVFDKPPLNTTKVILSTNIAETSITINDITIVIDTGRVKTMSYNSSKRCSQLVDSWTSQSSCNQRKGRAGRVQSGDCYRVFSEQRYHSMDIQLPAEIHRVSLEQLCLQIKALQLGSITAFMQNAIESPKYEAVNDAVNELIRIGALENRTLVNGGGSTERILDSATDIVLTPLGNHLAMLPMDARIGKLLIYGSILCCIDPVATIAAIICSKSPFIAHLNNEDLQTKQEQFKNKCGGPKWKSDHLLLWKVIGLYESDMQNKTLKDKRTYCIENGLAYDTVENILDLKVQYLQHLEAIGFMNNHAMGIPANPKRSSDIGLNSNSDKIRIIKAALCAGLYNNIVHVVFPEQKYIQSAHGTVAMANEAKQIKFFVQHDSMPISSEPNDTRSSSNRVFLHPSSCNFSQVEYSSPWLLYTDIVQTSKPYIRASTMINPYPLLLFGGKLEVKHEEGLLELDNWIQFHAVARIGVLIKEIRKQLDQILLRKIDDPYLNINKSPLIFGITQLILSEGMNTKK